MHGLSSASARPARRLVCAALFAVTGLAGALSVDLTSAAATPAAPVAILTGQVTALRIVVPVPALRPARRPSVAPKAPPRVAPTPAVARATRRTPAARPARVAAKRPAPFTAAEADGRGRAAYTSLNHALPRGWRLDVKVYAGTNQGLANSGTKVVTLWVRASDSPSELRITLAHEMGHVLDYTTLTDRDRQRYRALRDRSDNTAPWYPANGTSDYASPAGDFAEVYALWRGGSGDFRSTFAPQPDRPHLDEVVRLFRELEGRET